MDRESHDSLRATVLITSTPGMVFPNFTWLIHMCFMGLSLQGFSFGVSMIYWAIIPVITLITGCEITGFHVCFLQIANLSFHLQGVAQDLAPGRSSLNKWMRVRVKNLIQGYTENKQQCTAWESFLRKGRHYINF